MEVKSDVVFFLYWLVVDTNNVGINVKDSHKHNKIFNYIAKVGCY